MRLIWTKYCFDINDKYIIIIPRRSLVSKLYHMHYFFFVLQFLNIVTYSFDKISTKEKVVQWPFPYSYVESIVP